MVRVLFLCLGNICRSPMAEAMFRHMIEKSGYGNQIEVDSAGLGGWHAGERPHRGTREILTRYGIPHDWIRSRQIGHADIDKYDFIVAMDAENIAGLAKLGATDPTKVFRLLDLAPDANTKDVPDPWYTGNFDEVYELVKAGCEALLQRLITHYHLSPTFERR